MTPPSHNNALYDLYKATLSILVICMTASLLLSTVTGVKVSCNQASSKITFDERICSGYLRNLRLYLSKGPNRYFIAINRALTDVTDHYPLVHSNCRCLSNLRVGDLLGSGIWGCNSLHRQFHRDSRQDDKRLLCLLVFWTELAYYSQFGYVRTNSTVIRDRRNTDSNLIYILLVQITCFKDVPDVENSQQLYVEAQLSTSTQFIDWRTRKEVTTPPSETRKKKVDVTLILDPPSLDSSSSSSSSSSQTATP